MAKVKGMHVVFFSVSLVVSLVIVLKIKVSTVVQLLDVHVFARG